MCADWKLAGFLKECTLKGLTIVIGMVGSLRETGVHLHLSQTVAWGEIQSDSESCQPALAA